MSNRIATISGMSAQISAKASPCGALSLLSLDLTRGCRVQWGAPGGRKPAGANAPHLEISFYTGF